MSTSSLISVIVCTRNRSSKLHDTLRAFQKISYHGSWEIIFVDNGSTDDTFDILHEESKRKEIPLKAFREKSPGLARARNFGFANSSGSIVAFTDDDCYPEFDYLTEIQECFRDSNASYCGGQVRLYDRSDLPITIQESNEFLDIPPKTFIRTGRLHGANMVMRSALFEQLRGFDERLGAGTAYYSAEDVDLFRRANWAGASGLYNPRIVVYHHHGRKTMQEKATLLRGYDYGHGASLIKFLSNSHARREYSRYWYWHLRTCSWRVRSLEIRGALNFWVENKLRGDSLWQHEPAGLNLLEQ